MEEYAETLDWIRKLKPELEESTEAECQWSEYVEFWEKLLVRRNESRVRKPEQARRLVRRGWLVANLDRQVFESKFDLTGNEKDRAFVAVLENTGDGWRPPPALSMSLQLHPRLQSLTKDLRPLTPKEEFWRKIELAKALDKPEDWNQENQYAKMLAQAAEGVDLALDDPMAGENDRGWLYAAENHDSFWRLLNAVVRFGRRQALFDVFHDGSMTGKVRASIINPPGKKPNPWREVVRAAVKGLQKQGKADSPAKVLACLGGAKDQVNDAGPCVFSSPELAAFPEISWSKFQGLVKSVRRDE